MSFKYPRYQFALFRMIFGLYLMVHFIMLLPVSAEIWGSSGMVADVTLNLTYGVFPNILYLFNSPTIVMAFIGLLILLSFFVTIGFYRRVSTLLLWYGWACLFHQNNLILNPGLPMVGWLLLAMALIPKGEGWGVERREENWAMPAILYWGAWIIAGVAYTISGIDKALAPSWQDGSAILHLLNNPLARDYFMRDVFLALPEIALQLLTWLTLALEILFGLLVLFGRTRMYAWFMIMAMHLGILMIVDFADLTLGVVMLHLFVFNAAWFESKEAKRVVLFDGVCGFCNKSVDLLLKLDEEKIFRYSSLQGEYAKGLSLPSEAMESIVFVEDDKLYYKSNAVLKIVISLGGVWRVMGIFYLIPRVMRDGIYDVIAKYRYKIYGKLESCRMPKKDEATLFLD
jgi:predicted DCC family thiol-disulfide oxidoreductase YuxK/uncharacterized membrane protein YphA (DoxX/SURF4 family)